MRDLQREAAQELASGQLNPSDQFGAKLGIQDALKEEILLLEEEEER
jgi:hypothetical protein